MQAALRLPNTRIRDGPHLNHLQDHTQRVQIFLLGGFDLVLDGKTVDDAAWRLRNSQTLIKLLALAPGTRLRRERVLDMLWPDLDTDAAANNFHRTLHFARDVLERYATNAPGATIELRHGTVNLEPEGEIWIDVAAYEAAASEALHRGSMGHFEQAVTLYRGDLLPEDRYAGWARNRRTVLHETHLVLLLEMARRHQRRNELAPAQEAFLSILALEPAHEDAHAGLMRIHARLGRRHQALRQYRLLAEVMERDLGSAPSASTERLFRDIEAGRFSIDDPDPLIESEDDDTSREPGMPGSGGHYAFTAIGDEIQR